MNTVFALLIVNWVGFTRWAWVQTLSVKQRDRIEAARALGTNEITIITRHILSLITAPLIVEATFAGVVDCQSRFIFSGARCAPPAGFLGQYDS